MKKKYSVLWSFNHNATVDDCSTVIVNAYDEQGAKSEACLIVNNHLMFIIAVNIN